MTKIYLLCIGADAPNEERLCSVQSFQEFGQRGLKKTRRQFSQCLGLLLEAIFGLKWPVSVYILVYFYIVASDITWNWALMLGGFFFLCRWSSDLVVRSCSVKLTINFIDRESIKFCTVTVQLTPQLHATS